MAKANEPIKVTVSEFKGIARAFLKKKNSYAIRLDGGPGTGKSEIIAQLAAEFDYNFLDTRLAFKDNVDLAGHLIPNREKKIAEFLKPEDLPNENGKPWLWFFDEVNRVMHPTMFNTLFQLISNNKCGTHVLPKDTFIFLAGNLGEADGTIVTEFDDAALNSRCARFLLDPTFADWRAWAETASIENTLIQFLDKNKEYFAHLKGRPWAQVNETMGLFEDPKALLRKSDTTLSKMLGALVGKEAVNEYIHFLKDFEEVDELQILDDFSKHKKILEATARERLFTLNGKIIAHFKRIEENKSELSVKQNHLENAIRYALFLDKDTGAKFASDLFTIYKILSTYTELHKEKKLTLTNDEILKLKERYK